jgi:hypothetical protein
LHEVISNPHFELTCACEKDAKELHKILNAYLFQVSKIDVIYGRACGRIELIVTATLHTYMPNFAEYLLGDV